MTRHSNAHMTFFVCLFICLIVGWVSVLPMHFLPALQFFSSFFFVRFGRSDFLFFCGACCHVYVSEAIRKMGSISLNSAMTAMIDVLFFISVFTLHMDWCIFVFAYGDGWKGRNKKNLKRYGFFNIARLHTFSLHVMCARIHSNAFRNYIAICFYVAMETCTSF